MTPPKCWSELKFSEVAVLNKQLGMFGLVGVQIQFVFCRYPHHVCLP